MHKVYHRVENIAGSVINIRAEDVKYRELASVTSRAGTSLAQVIRLNGDEVSLQVFAGARGVATDAKVHFLGHAMQVPFSDALLGRVFTGGATPRDRGPSLSEGLIDIGGPSVNPAKRIIPRNMVRTGIPMIDVFNTLVESQKLPVFAKTLVSKLVLQLDA